MARFYLWRRRGQRKSVEWRGALQIFYKYSLMRRFPSPKIPSNGWRRFVAAGQHGAASKKRLSGGTMRTMTQQLHRAAARSRQRQSTANHLPSAPAPMSDWTYRAAALAAALLLLATAGGAL
jgi:hypothetical protein